MSAAYDVVIIGSGAGGSPVAERLASAGAKVLLVERGRRFVREDFDRDEIEWCRRDRFVPSPRSDPHMRRDDEGARATPSTDGWISTVVGGGTVHMGGYMLRAHDDDARQAARVQGVEGQSALDWPIPFRELARHYEAAERELGVSGAPYEGAMPPLADHPLGLRVDEAAKANGMSCRKTPRGILTAPRPGDDRRVCSYHDLCASYGCPEDAKASMTATYLRRAERSGNLTLWPNTRALALIPSPDNKSAAGVRVLKQGEGQLDVKARVVVVACGAIESARLLLLSGGPFASEQVGKNLWFSLFVEASGFFDKAKHGAVEQLMAGSPFLNRTLMQGGHLSAARAKAAGVDRTGTLQMGFVHDNPIHRAERVATEGGLLWGAKLKQELVRAFTGGRTVVVEGFGESLPHPGAYVDLDPHTRDPFGKPSARITYSHHPRDSVVAREMAKDARAVLLSMGADDIRVTRALDETTVLQGGTCRMGTSPADSVVGPDGCMHGLTNVFVSDGGALPSSTTVPITLTIVANALRTSEHIKQRLAAL